MIKKGADIHDYDRRILLSVKRLNNSDRISPANRKAILRFIEDCKARTISKARIDFYLNRLSRLAEWCDKPFDALTKDDVKKLVSVINTQDYTDRTKIDYKLSLKSFVKFLKGIDEKGVYPEEVRWISLSLGHHGNKLPEDLLTQQEVEAMIGAAEHSRDKALIAMLYETGCRIGELASLKIKNVTFDNYGAVIVVTGKTGMRRVRMICYVSYVSNWLGIHPDRQDPESPLWVVIGTTKGIAKKKNPKGHKFNWSYSMKYKTITAALERAAKKAGITKPINPHHFRHSRATQLASSLTEAQLKEMFGWTQSSAMASVYVHMSGRDVDDALLKAYGLKEKAPEQDTEKPSRCPRCSDINPPNFKFCGKCGMALDLKAVVEKEEKMKTAFSFMDDSMDGEQLDKKLEEWVNKKVEAALKERMKKV